MERTFLDSATTDCNLLENSSKLLLEVSCCELNYDKLEHKNATDQVENDIKCVSEVSNCLVENSQLENPTTRDDKENGDQSKLLRADVENNDQFVAEPTKGDVENIVEHGHEPVGSDVQNTDLFKAENVKGNDQLMFEPENIAQLMPEPAKHDVTFNQFIDKTAKSDNKDIDQRKHEFVKLDVEKTCLFMTEPESYEVENINQLASEPTEYDVEINDRLTHKSAKCDAENTYHLLPELANCNVENTDLVMTKLAKTDIENMDPYSSDLLMDNVLITKKNEIEERYIKEESPHQCSITGNSIQFNESSRQSQKSKRETVSQLIKHKLTLSDSSYNSDSCGKVYSSLDKKPLQALYSCLLESSCCSPTAVSSDDTSSALSQSIEKFPKIGKMWLKDIEFPQIYPEADMILWRGDETQDIYPRHISAQSNEDATSDTYLEENGIQQTLCKMPEIDITSQTNFDMNNSSNDRNLYKKVVTKPFYIILLTRLLSNRARIMGLLVLIIAVIWGLIHHNIPSRVDNSPLKMFVHHVSFMQQSFPNQNERLWKTVKASSTRILRQLESTHPAVIILASSSLVAPVTLCIAKQISAGFDKAFGLTPDTPLIDISQMNQRDIDNEMLHLDNVLHSAFSTKKRKSFILENLQNLSPSPALIFYNYCDSDDAPFKDVMLLFTFYYNENKNKLDNPKAVEDYLKWLWSSRLGSDKVKPLLSRVATNIVMIANENLTSIADKCT